MSLQSRAEPAFPRYARARARRTKGLAGITLVEILISLAVMALLGGVSVLAMGVVESARLKRSGILVSSAIRVAYAHANATSKTVRLVFDFEERSITLEESTSKLLLARGDRTGGAAAATDAERLMQEANEEADLVKALKPPRPAFQPSKAFGFDPDDGKAGKVLESGIRFLQIETAHQDEPEVERAYLYFWPGGETERASIQLVRGRPGAEPEEGDILTVVVHPLTGKTELKKGRVAMPRPRDDREESERDEEF
ncbi:MAG: prepilin-type cleavage/methylation domain-containing protein [Polyangiaceae bacterium]|nr:prepilin-type cleavage/methylation domain-containing protein [Polyangiaceae bacterium]